MTSHKSAKKIDRERAKPRYARLTFPKGRYILEICLVVFLAVAIFEMTKPLRAQWYYRQAKHILNAVAQKKINPREHPQAVLWAIKKIQRGLRLTPSNGKMWSCMGDLLNFIGQNRASLISYKTALRYFRSPSLYINLGVVCVKLKMYDEAEEALNRALAFRPGQKDAQDALKMVKALRMRDR